MCSKGSQSPPLQGEDREPNPSPSPGPTSRDRKKRRHREKRKRSCSTDSTSSSPSRRHKKKKKKKKRDDDPPSPRVNPIFLWVKQDHTKIVEVLCEDYDKRNRIRLTKTPGGWVAIPRTARMCLSPAPPKVEEPSDAPDVRMKLVEEKTVDEAELEKHLEEVEDDEIEEVQEIRPLTEVINLDSSDEETVVKEERSSSVECKEENCCSETNVDENHNNEVDCQERLEYCKNIEQEKVEAVEKTDEKIVNEEHQENCVSLMNELADMCFVERLKEEVAEETKVLDDIYEFVPSPPTRTAKEELKGKGYVPVHEIKKDPSPEPMNLVIHPKKEPLKPCPDLESLDILWRLPAGTTISHSKPPMDAKPTLQPCPPERPAAFSMPVQEEPLNLGKPKKEKVVPPPVEEKKMRKPLDQLKEVLSDPDLMVPDPLLVPRARLPALIANPAKEIPRLLAQKQHLHYPKVEPDLMVVSLAHLQSILQKSGKEEELRLYQEAVLQDKMEAANALNQMLWLPYLSGLEAKQSQELMAMLYPHYMYPQQPRHHYPPSWPRPNTSRPPSKPKLKVRDKELLDPKLRMTSHVLPPPTPPPHLWHPLFSSPEGGKYTTSWSWTSPVTVSGE